MNSKPDFAGVPAEDSRHTAPMHSLFRSHVSMAAGEVVSVAACSWSSAHTLSGEYPGGLGHADRVDHVGTRSRIAHCASCKASHSGRPLHHNCSMAEEHQPHVLPLLVPSGVACVQRLRHSGAASAHYFTSLEHKAVM